MSNTAIDTAGTAEGVKLEANGRLGRKERQAVDKALNAGILVPLEGLHPKGYHDDCSVLMRPETHQAIEDAETDYRHRLYRLVLGDNWRKKIQQKGMSSLPNGGEKAIAIEGILATVLGWTGPLEDSDDNLVQMDEMGAEDVRRFLRAHYLPEWAVSPKQKSLPPYDPDNVDQDFLAMLNRANLELDVNPLAIAAHLRGKDSSSPFVVMHDGIFRAQEQPAASDS